MEMFYKYCIKCKLFLFFSNSEILTSKSFSVSLIHSLMYLLHTVFGFLNSERKTQIFSFYCVHIKIF